MRYMLPNTQGKTIKREEHNVVMLSKKAIDGFGKLCKEFEEKLFLLPLPSGKNLARL